MSDFENNYSKREDFSDEDFESDTDDCDRNYSRQRIVSDNSDEVLSDSDDDDGNTKKSELELLREKNIKELDAFLKQLMNNPEYAEVMATAKELKVERARAVRKNKTRNTNSTRDPSFRSHGYISSPYEIRRSCRLQNIPPVFFKEDLIDDEREFTRKRKRNEEYDYYDLEAVIYRPKKSRASSNTIRPYVIPVEEVTEEMMANIARKGAIKVYSDSGTSCHQCRQKTKDQKTCCRSPSCFGVRGQFCGVCLENRYGEDVAVALTDPQWECPVCRGICNCSFCRAKAGKRPTGILAPLAQQAGHKSVKDFLESLKGEGDFAHQDTIWQKVNNPKYLLGYSKDLKFAHMGKNIKIEVNYFLTLEQLNKIIWKKECELDSMIDLHDEPRSLLGFINGTDEARMDDGSYCYMTPVYFGNFSKLLQQLENEINAAQKQSETKGKNSKQEFGQLKQEETKNVGMTKVKEECEEFQGEKEDMMCKN